MNYPSVYVIVLNWNHLDDLILTIESFRNQTYHALIEHLDRYNMVVLGFCPENKKEYGVLALQNGHVRKIIEAKYWKSYSTKRQSDLRVCNSGIYAVRKKDLLKYLSILAQRPHTVRKKVDNRILEFEEYFITDLVEYMSDDGLAVGYIIVDNEKEVMGVDDIEALKVAQQIFRESYFQRA